MSTIRSSALLIGTALGYDLIASLETPWHRTHERDRTPLDLVGDEPGPHWFIECISEPGSVFLKQFYQFSFSRCGAKLESQSLLQFLRARVV